MGRFSRLFKRRRQRTRDTLPVSDQLLVGDVTSEGFMIERLIGDLKKVYHWRDMRDVEVDMRRRILYFHTYRSRTFVVPAANHEGWYKLLYGVPDGFPGFDYVVRDVFFEKLMGCAVCGALAVENGECLACYTMAYSGQEEGPEEYYREKQLGYFALQLGPGLGNLPLPPPDGFTANPDFQLRVTDGEVYEYQRRITPDLL